MKTDSHISLIKQAFNQGLFFHLYYLKGLIPGSVRAQVFNDFKKDEKQYLILLKGMRGVKLKNIDPGKAFRSGHLQLIALESTKTFIP